MPQAEEINSTPDEPDEIGGNSASVHIRITLDVVLDSNGEDPDYLAQRMNSAIFRAIMDGALLTGDTAAEVRSHDFRTTLLEPQAAALDEDTLADSSGVPTEVMAAEWLRGWTRMASKPEAVVSGFRDRERNLQVGGGRAANSMHLRRASIASGDLDDLALSGVDQLGAQITWLGQSALKDGLQDAMARGKKHGFPITRDNVVEVVREELGLVGVGPEEWPASVRESVLSMFDDLTDSGGTRGLCERPRSGGRSA